MKIEKVNDNQIRCTLTKEDLASRQIRLSELAYGSEKARELFKDMISQANYEFGFNVDDIPLMVEAIPVSADSIILVITKCEYPEELDTRFSKFSEPDPALLGEMNAQPQNKQPQGAADIVDLFKKAYEQAAKADESAKEKINTEEKKEESAQEIPAELKDFARLFELTNFAQAERLAKVLDQFYHGESAFFKNPANDRYYLSLHKGEHSPEEFNKVCNIASEYAKQKTYSRSQEAFFVEHGYVLIEEAAVETLSSLS